LTNVDIDKYQYGVLTRRAAQTDLAGLVALLSAASLPLDGALEAFESGVVAEESGALVGGAAVERFGPSALLRSVVVREDRRGRRIGHAIVDAAEQLARESGASRVYLLTESAEDWFARLGYQRIGRGAVPADVAASVEFTTACADTAIAMVKPLVASEGR
jgi:N-acetylglutamate synthase-like GNAT family acetyltransferase